MIKDKLLAAAAGAALIAVPVTADALTINLFNAGDNLTIEDGGVGDADGNVDGVILTSLLTVGDATVQVAVTAFTDASGKSELALDVINAVTASQGLTIRAGHTGFAAGEGQPTAINFVMNASHLVGGTIQGDAGADDNNVLWACGLGGCFGQDTLFSTADDINTTVFRNLSDPFSMGMAAIISANTETTFDATMTAEIPLPAAGLMLLTALGGLGVAKRRRKAA